LKSLAFLSQESGSGKTTLAINLATAAQQAGERVALIDTDPQESASSWAQGRKTENPAVFKALTPNLPGLLDKAKAEGRTIAVIDTASHSTPGMDIIAKLADFLIIPAVPPFWTLWLSL
jgi:chromosome partitioning protein